MPLSGTKPSPLGATNSTGSVRVTYRRSRPYWHESGAPPSPAPPRLARSAASCAAMGSAFFVAACAASSSVTLSLSNARFSQTPCSFEIRTHGMRDARSQPPMAKSSGPERLLATTAADAPFAARASTFCANVAAGSRSASAIHGPLGRPPQTSAPSTSRSGARRGGSGNSHENAAATDRNGRRSRLGLATRRVDVSSGSRLTRSKWRCGPPV
mmetsp:Transcript_17639/g.55001  ORF Transcript_17639/g.55001 Transcript_17639/m.55001 type:complete len:213 (+) Transcript_17639:42-680(+)